jgi:hypothetical protein
MDFYLSISEKTKNDQRILNYSFLYYFQDKIVRTKLKLMFKNGNKGEEK